MWKKEYNMPKMDKVSGGTDENFSYQPTMIGDSYQPTVKVTAIQNIVPPSGGTGAVTLHVKTVGIETSKKG
jgi:hypothetical protein